MKRVLLTCLSFAVLIFASGCTMMAPQYSASIENVQKLKDKGIGNVKVSDFQLDEKSMPVNDFSLRGSSLKSPYDDSYAAYLAEAIKQELSLAGKLAPNSNTDISCLLIKNNIDASGFSTGTGDIEARFIVKRDGTQRYNEKIAAHTSGSLHLSVQ